MAPAIPPLGIFDLLESDNHVEIPHIEDNNPLGIIQFQDTIFGSSCARCPSPQ